ncbi:MAG: chemotaxis protein CheX [Bryobacteraceae bacterium]|nr:chemotaxis protein CheX [Bryobacteraceae bacterium]
MVQFPVEAYQSEVTEIVSNVFATMLGSPPIAVDQEWTPEPGRITAVVYFAGEWKGAVLIECGEDLARHWTACLMSIEEPKEYGDDVEDAMGEIANMVGGNLKSVLPSGVGLSMPSVVRGRNYSIKICGGNLTSRQSFRTADGPFWVTLVEVVDRR